MWYTQSMTRKGYLSDVSNDVWAFVASYLTLMREDSPQREYSLPAVFNGLSGTAPLCRHGSSPASLPSVRTSGAKHFSPSTWEVSNEQDTCSSSEISR